MFWRISSTVSFGLLMAPREVRTRGPGSTPRLSAVRRSPSMGDPTLWTVVKPPINCDVSILHCIAQGLGLRGISRLTASVRAKVPPDMDVGVDHAGKHSQIVQIVRCPRSRSGSDLLNLRTFNNNRGISLDPSFTIEEGSHLQHCLLLCEERSRRN